jgi:hypothetical protein
MKIKALNKQVFLLITHQQMRNRNKVQLGDNVIEIMDHLNPNHWSVEDALVVSAAPGTFYQPGDYVLIDFSIFTAGLSPDMSLSTSTKKVMDVPEGAIYRATVDISGPDKYSEIFSKVKNVDGGWVFTPTPGTILIDQEPTQESFKQEGLLYVPVETQPRDKPFRVKVLASGIPEIKPGMWVWVRGEGSLPIEGRWKLEYVYEAEILTRESE